MKVTALYEYPVKGLQGHSLCCAGINKRGLAMDRRWMLADDTGNFISQRQSALLTRLLPSFKDKLSIVHLPTGEEVSLDTREFSELSNVQVWGQEISAHTTQNVINQWLSDKVGQSVRLVYMDEHDIRPIKNSASNIVSFADGYPVLLTTKASLVDLNSRLEQTIEMDRFRPNIVIDGLEPFAEDNWQKIKIGSVTFKVAKKCARCHVININQQNGESGKEPLKTLSTYRKEGNKVNFGINLIPENSGIIHDNDKVETLS